MAEAVWKTFNPEKLNIEMLGNTANHLHWHVFPRYANDPNPSKPIWVIDEKIRKAEGTKPSQKALDEMKNGLGNEIKKLLQHRQ
ncbi:MAG: HIT domain-containing protein [Patescibacteria group bacterium]